MEVRVFFLTSERSERPHEAAQRPT